MQTAVKYHDYDETPSQPFTEKLIDRQAAADYLRFSVNGLAGLLRRGEGPPYLRIGRAIRFSPSALKAWAAAQIEINSTSNI